METTKIPLARCVESSYQNRKGLGDASGLARSIEVNGQITPLIVVADGDACQLVAGHRRTAVMRSLGLEEADAYEAMQVRIVEFAKGTLPKFPPKGQTKLRQWAHEAYEAAYECEPDDAWEGFKEPRARALDQFILMRTIRTLVSETLGMALCLAHPDHLLSERSGEKAFEMLFVHVQLARDPRLEHRRRRADAILHRLVAALGSDLPFDIDELPVRVDSQKSGRPLM